jgi:hypothetical protein
MNEQQLKDDLSYLWECMIDYYANCLKESDPDSDQELTELMIRISNALGVVPNES